MKKLSILILLVAISLNACREEEVDSQLEEVQFTFTAASVDSEGGRKNSDLPAGTSLLISLTDNSGNPVLTLQRFNLLKFGNDYTTEPLTLKRGYYKVTDFMLVDESSQVLYATPKRGSPLAAAVRHPLPYGFGVGRNSVKNVEMEVVDAQQSMPEDFGYASFNIDIVHPWSVSVFVTENGRASLTSAQAFLYKGREEQYTYSLRPRINVLSFKGDPAAEYSLVIVKEGYTEYSRKFVYSDLVKELGNEPLVVILESETTSPPTLSIMPADAFYGFAIDFTPPLSLTIDWGDGTTETHNLADQKFADFSHEYPGEFYEITVTGDLEKIYHFSNDAAATEINTAHLTGLREIAMYAGNLTTLDLTQNVNLNKLNFNNSAVKQFILPERHLIHQIIFDNDFQTENIDYLINNVYQNATATSLSGGYIYLLNPSIDPTAESLEKLQVLVDDYGWAVELR